MRVTRSGFSAMRCTVRVMLLRLGNVKSEERWNTVVFDDAFLQPSVYIQDGKEILLVIHDDDFLVAAKHQDALDLMYKEVSKVHELKKKIISSALEDAYETTCLNRKVEWDETNWMNYEGDEKHADVLLLSWRLVHNKAVSSTLTK